jgi:predicted  nucleic acid-binding Zn-ribbon protein
MSRHDHASGDASLGDLGLPAVRLRQAQNRIAHLEAERARLRQNVAELLEEFTDLRDRAVADAQTIAELRASCAQARQSRREWMRFAMKTLRELEGKA